jgi:DNA helicase HerA-like ATPase
MLDDSSTERNRTNAFAARRINVVGTSAAGKTTLAGGLADQAARELGDAILFVEIDPHSTHTRWWWWPSVAHMTNTDSPARVPASSTSPWPRQRSIAR